MSDFQATMHQIQLQLGLPQTLLGKLTALHRPLAGFKGPLRGEEGKEGVHGGERSPLMFSANLRPCYQV